MGHKTMGKVTGSAEKHPNLTGGSRNGIPNKINADIKAMILEALDKAGGADYLVAQSESNPTAFMTLVGKVLPMTVSGDPDSPLKVITRIELVGMRADA